MMLSDPVYIFLWRDLAIFLLFGAVLGVLLASLLIFTPQYLARVNHIANHWISTRHISRWLDRSISIEQWFYQHNRAVGIVVVLGASYILIFFSMLFDKSYSMQRMGVKGIVPPKLLDGLLDALVLSSLIGGTVALLVGLFLWLRPSLLRGVEAGANQWVTSRRATKMLDVPRYDLDQFVAHHAKRAGWLLLLGSIYLFVVVFRVLA